MLQLKVDPYTEFWTVVNGKEVKAKKGDWVPTFYKFVEEKGKRWLIASDLSVVFWHGQLIQLERVECPIKHMENLEKPMTAIKLCKYIA